MVIPPKPPPNKSNAPTVDFTPIRIKWTPSGIDDFAIKVTPVLDHLVANFTISSSKALFEIFFSSVNDTLIKYATATNKSITLSLHHPNHQNTPY